MVRNLIVNADDLGLTVGVNDGIFDAHDHGILTSASLFAGAPATFDAIRRARSRPSLGVGVHLALVDGAPTLPPRRIPTLVDADGRFRRSWKPFIVACLRGRVSLAEVELELAAQFDRLRSAGVRLTHLDAHKHVHAYPPVFAVVARLAGRFGIPVVRVPYERWPQIGGDAGSRGTLWRQALLNAALLSWARRDYATAASYGLQTPRFIGRIHTGILSASALAGLVRSVPPGVTELMVHPGYADADLERTGTRLLESRQTELDLLCRLETRALIIGERIDLLRHDLTHVIKRSVRHVS
ncbi:MAG TPA: ChbG/HpnK family deacetylase [Vicinamibacterales bacterium]|nr:ChbG/HpnK family deacetylase [Vicinamibacterales bacterium]